MLALFSVVEAAYDSCDRAATTWVGVDQVCCCFQRPPRPKALSPADPIVCTCPQGDGSSRVNALTFAGTKIFAGGSAYAMFPHKHSPALTVSAP